ncbi:UDP-N-acetylgalactosamine-undecaprenyl-phosphate N-acetylgalactosaminephosphotransferase [Pedobacter sp. Bi27]|uniref:sugar transferase n=1 Tax=unclassified Pedobacter TaxID=2628915 RepID=UPI001D8A6E43|nr:MULTISPECIES: sugar transferase [unclassified Pedobacter]CAH0135160.1 UDP-N-acetylgalactosamine-undecaprenyl-phosphate N-acetylgalactosaminephosphotransferase [Pedobacter sp. Bi36]CAH0190673.1 UDP-N-acetylgalactosamine-undecaprenyl-phosphate N-acetylgalactosaminephosphotransferase [Pedobacter sp. Bi126]CAH0249885.1 UDP-N-acetylgalactosamine-undecaprenyl-phosphate N-acetylgalactosaminephosphotransferase [Pedobacter sp. Bi27]
MKINKKRIFDVVFAILCLVLFSPLLILIAILIKLDSKGPVIFKQIRVGRNMKDFHLAKFRTMYVIQGNNSLLTIGNRDNRITRIGYWLRKYKLDELPQLLNVLKGQMSFVGPRPEVRKYVNLYNEEQRYVLSVKPGITDWASVEFCNENELLKHAEDPETYYIERIIPAKIKQNMRYIKHNDILTDFKIIWLTINRIVIN